MSARLRVTVDECIHEYRTIGDEVFGHPGVISSGGTFGHELDCKPFEKVIEDVTGNHCEKIRFESLSEIDRLDQDTCQHKELACADIPISDYPYLFRTYPTPPPRLDLTRTETRSRSLAVRNHGDAHVLPIWQVARTTTAAPGYFPPMSMRSGNGPEVVTFKDGGSNNPSEEAYYEIANKHGGSKNMGLFIGIGTGSVSLNVFSGKEGEFKHLRNIIAYLKTAMNEVTTTSEAQEKMIDISNDDGVEQFPHHKFDGGERLGKVGLAEWESYRNTFITGRDKTRGCKTLEGIEAAIAIYLQRADVQQDIKEDAKILVERRRHRILNESGWDRYASFFYYEHNFRRCGHEKITTTLKFKEHIGREHCTIVDD